MKRAHSIKVMGIININRESFYPESRHLAEDEVVETIREMIQDGADIIDIGACSTKPGSTPVSMEQEWEYLKKPLKKIAALLSTASLQHIISIDTYRSSIVRRAYDIIGPFIVNDISAGEDDGYMLETVAELGLPYIAMHKRGTPDTMQSMTEYPAGVVNEVLSYFKDFAKKTEQYGIADWILDPGFGFGKTVEQNYQLLANLDKLTHIPVHKTAASAGQAEEAAYAPVLVGLSRKSMIYKPLGITPQESLPGTCALNLAALERGATILRVHDVKEAAHTARLYQKLHGL